VALLSGQSDATGYDLTRAYWQKQHAGADFDQFWRKSLHDGGLRAPHILEERDGKPAEIERAIKNEAVVDVSLAGGPPITSSTSAATPLLRRQFSNNGWLQELPKR